jgi:hypothetical protein
MDNKDKIIEEMAKIIEKAKQHIWASVRTQAEDEDYLWHSRAIAEHLTEQGYRKIGDSVVLSKEEYSNYLITQTNNAWLKEQAEKLQADNERLYKNLGKFKQSVSKETAEKIWLQAKTIVDKTKHLVQGREYLHIDALKEIVKSCGVGIKE